MKTAISVVIFLFATIYTLSYAVYEYKQKNKVGAAGIVCLVIITALSFSTYLKT